MPNWKFNAHVDWIGKENWPLDIQANHRSIQIEEEKIFCPLLCLNLTNVRPVRLRYHFSDVMFEMLFFSQSQKTNFEAEIVETTLNSIIQV